MSKNSLGEEQIIRLLWNYIGIHSHGKDPFVDDASWSSLPKKRFLVTKSDAFVSGTDAPPGMTPRQMAAKSITASVSDFAAKGVRPSYATLSILLPKDKAISNFVRGLGRGFSDASTEYSLRVLGGDTGLSSQDVVINCSLYGFSNRIVSRKGAKRNHIVGVTGLFGLQAAGLLILLNKAQSASKQFTRNAVDSVLNPKAKLATGLELAKYLSSSIDSSDGLAISLHYLAEGSRVSVELDSLPFARGVREFASENSLDPLSLVLFGGEEYEIVCTYPESSRKAVEELGVISIGRVEISKDASSAVSFNGMKIKRKGWMHFVSD